MKHLIGCVLAGLASILMVLALVGPILRTLEALWPTIPAPAAIALLLGIPSLVGGGGVALLMSAFGRK